MTTDNRTNEPTPEQVEAAAKALHETRNPWFGAYGDWGAAGFEIKKAFRESARAALEAAARTAQGAAPQAEGAPKSSYISPSLPAMIRNLWKSDPSENSVRTALKLAGDLIQELIDLRAAPVPSSGVDEAELAEVIEAEIEKLRHETRLYPDIYKTEVARAVAEWLRG